MSSPYLVYIGVSLFIIIPVLIGCAIVCCYPRWRAALYGEGEASPEAIQEAAPRQLDEPNPEAFDGAAPEPSDQADPEPTDRPAHANGIGSPRTPQGSMMFWNTSSPTAVDTSNHSAAGRDGGIALRSVDERTHARNEGPVLGSVNEDAPEPPSGFW